MWYRTASTAGGRALLTAALPRGPAAPPCRRPGACFFACLACFFPPLLMRPPPWLAALAVEAPTRRQALQLATGLAVAPLLAGEAQAKGEGPKEMWGVAGTYTFCRAISAQAAAAVFSLASMTLLRTSSPFNACECC